LALANLGARVLYCQNPTSFLRHPLRLTKEVSKGVHAFQPVVAGQRLNIVPPLRYLQGSMVRRQIAVEVEKLGLHDPLFIFFAMKGLFPLYGQVKGKWFLVYVCADHGEPEADACVRISDATLAIPRSVFHQLRAKFGSKVHLIPQSVDSSRLARVAEKGAPEPAVFAGIPRPRLGYLGLADGRLNTAMLFDLLRPHPEWHFVSVGHKKALPLPNVHVIPWASPEEFASYAQAVDICFLPHDCYSERQFHCVPLKMFEAFAFGTPVVATPIMHLWEYDDVIYFGDTALEMASAIEAALNEAPESPKRAARVEIARKHSLENLAAILRQCLPLEGERVPVALPAVPA
jgi:glycosyltransferase involved in cell wall biosynthesis